MGARQSRVSTEPARVALGVVLERAPEQLVAELVAQHVQDAPGLFIEVAVEDVDRPLRIAGTPRRAGSAPPRLRVAVSVGQELPRRPRRGPWRVFAPDVLEVGRKALVEPGLRTTRGRVTRSPHHWVRQLVREPALDGRGPARRARRAARGGRSAWARRSVLHAAEDEVGHGESGCSARADSGCRSSFRKRRRSCRAWAAEACAARRPRGPGGHEVIDVDRAGPARALLDSRRRGRTHQRHQVGADGGSRARSASGPFFFPPGSSVRSRRLTVREHEVAGPNRADHLRSTPSRSACRGTASSSANRLVFAPASSNCNRAGRGEAASGPQK